MKRVSGIFIFVVFLIVNLTSSVNAQNTSNKGTDFWVGYAGHIDGKLSRMTLFLSSDVNTTYKVEAKGQTIASGNIVANVVTAVFVDPNIVDVLIATSDLVELNKGIHISTDRPVSVYSVISNNARTGGSLILPTKALGREYYAFSYQNLGNQSGNVSSQFTIVAVEDDTEIEITPTVASTGGTRLANVTFKITQKLNKGDVYQYQAPSDVSGSVIKTLGNCKPVAVFSGSTWTAFCESGNPRTPSGGDNLYQQLFPLSSWGKNFVTAPFYNTENGNTDAIRIIVSEDNTTITVNGSTTLAATTTLVNPYKKGSIITYFTNKPSIINADKPIGVAQYQTAQSCNLSNPSNIQNPLFPGDPEMTILNPIEQTLSDITVFSKLNSVPGVKTNIQKYFLNVIIKTVDAPSLKVDGNVVTGFKVINNEYSYVIIDVTSLQDQHRIVATGGFVAIAYGYGQVESYAYLAGADVKNLYQNLVATSLTNKVVTSGCVNEPFKFTLKLPYPSSSIVWDLFNGQSPYTDLSPVFTTTVIDDKTIYVYNYPLADPVYKTAGNYMIKTTALNPSPSGCDAQEAISMNFEVYDPPTAAFTVLSQSCPNTAITFTDASNGNGKMITKWMWDFGNGQTSSIQNPIHSYTTSGTFKVKLTVEGETGCASLVAQQDILISILPIANFNFTTPDCATKAVTFTDASTSAEGAIIKWTWDFGDGSTPEDHTSAAAFTHSYTDTGTYKVTLKVLTDKGCESIALVRAVVVHPNPAVNFVVPEVCISDQFAAFTDSTTISDGSTQFTYLWNFGDPNATNVTNTSALKNPTHKYTQAATYQVTLTVTSKDGCVSTLTKPFQVNGATPKANFVVLSPGQLCSNKEVVFTNTSTVDFGSVGKLEWYFDYGNSSTIKIVDDNPVPNKEYRFQYPVFSSPASKNYTVRLLAYSGGSCVDEEIQTITVKAAPKVSFTALSEVCQEVTPFQITQAKEINSQSGTEAYYGSGVSISGIFDPAKAGVGTHTLKYVFTASNGCADSLSQDIKVMPSPILIAGRDSIILEGGEIKLSAVATGSNLTYKWIPARGLSRDDIPDPLAAPTDDVTYTLTVTSDQGCVATDNVFIKVLKLPEVPNTFTPNGDGVNDVWNIKYLNSYVNASVQIFNRYGLQIFGSVGYSIPWDGTFNGTDLPVGTYYYIIQPKTGRKAIPGSVTILR